MSQPVTLHRLLNSDQEQLLGEVQEQLDRLSARIILLRLAVYRRGNQELTAARLERLAASLQHASQDVRAARRSLENGR
jgi:hypothetical protein